VTLAFGAVTIGQAPRPDITADILAVLGKEYSVIERGALDGLSAAGIARLYPQPGQDVLVTRLTDGSVVQVAERHITPLVQQKVNGLFEEGIPLVVLLCTGDFPGFQANGVVLRPQELVNDAAAVLAKGKLTGVLCPTPAHILQMKRQWSAVLGAEPRVRAASPYLGMAEVEPAVRELKQAGVQVVILDCIAYTLEIKTHVQNIIGAEVLLPRSLAAEAIREYFERV
jgi:protein AroM